MNIDYFDFIIMVGYAGATIFAFKYDIVDSKEDSRLIVSRLASSKTSRRTSSSKSATIYPIENFAPTTAAVNEPV